MYLSTCLKMLWAIIDYHIAYYICGSFFKSFLPNSGAFLTECCCLCFPAEHFLNHCFFAEVNFICPLLFVFLLFMFPFVYLFLTCFFDEYGYYAGNIASISVCFC